MYHCCVSMLYMIVSLLYTSIEEPLTSTQVGRI